MLYNLITLLKLELRIFVIQSWGGATAVLGTVGGGIVISF